MGTVPLARQAAWGTAARGAWQPWPWGWDWFVAYRRWRPVGIFLRCAAATSVILVATFLFASPVSTLVNPPPVDRPEAAAAGGTADHPDVVVLVFDELPTLSLVDGSGKIDAERFPNFARFAGTSTWFRNHNSVAPETLVALPALTTGKMPIGATSLPYANYDSYPDNIFSLLGETYDVHAVEWATDLCPPSVCGGDEPELDATSRGLIEAKIAASDATGALVGAARTAWLQQIDPRNDVAEKTLSFPGADDSVQLAEPGLRFLSGLQADEGDTPTFDWLDVGLPHQPWRLLPSGNQHNGPDSPPGTALLGSGQHPIGHRARPGCPLQPPPAAPVDGPLPGQGPGSPGEDRSLRRCHRDRDRRSRRFVHARPDARPGPGQHGSDLLPAAVREGPRPDRRRGRRWQRLLTRPPPDRRRLRANVEIPWEVDGLSLANGVPRTDTTKVSLAFDPARFPSRSIGDVVFIEPTGLEGDQGLAVRHRHLPGRTRSRRPQRLPPRPKR